MTVEELLLRRAAGQYLSARTDARTAAAMLCGLQAQYLSAALHALRLRTGSEDTDGLVRTWTLRGTMHLIPETDLPLYRLRRGAPEDVCDTSWYRWYARTHGAPDPARERFFAALIADGVAHGVREREALRTLCRDGGMTDEEEARLFSGWGGMFAELAEAGVLCYDASPDAQRGKVYRLCPDFTPLSEEDARVELLRRYFTAYGPATLRDAAYFFHFTQAQLRQAMERLPLEHVECLGRTHFDLPSPLPEAPLPACLFLAGFDPLLMGYRKEENPVLPPEHLRAVFTLTGIVHPTILLRGRIVGRWKRQGRAVALTLFTSLPAKEKRLILRSAEDAFPGKSAAYDETSGVTSARSR